MDFKRVVDRWFSAKDMINLPRYEVHTSNDIVDLWTDLKEQMQPQLMYSSSNSHIQSTDLKFALNQHVSEITHSVTNNWNEYGFFDSMKPTFHNRIFDLVQKYSTICRLPDDDIELDDSDFEDICH
jgi:hypothetical protein